ncbi:hypothetical protein M5X17_27300 [Paenibacillus alvei]|uniref:hypothetical protein n=1 Tax=Paenibacillus alvei TaxID=44250 RepID=UPI00227F7A0C|nr:hypothetical protein [Paenibacillus alvei]MCY9737424.1 hypothetical protein [Paenibacillus alvei]
MAAKKTTAQTKESLLNAYQGVLNEAREEFQAIMDEQQAAWKKELARIKEEDLYQFNKEKRDREDALEVELAARKKSVEEREANVKSRELAIGDAEKTITELQSKVDAIPSEKAISNKEGYEQGRSDAKKDFDAEVRLIKAENDADKRVLQGSLNTARETIESYADTIDALKAELAAANARVEVIATNAVTAAGQSKVSVHTAQNK